MEAFNAAMEAGTSDAVKLWMNWMSIVFLASLIFVWKFKAARAVFLVLVLTMIGAVIVWSLTKNVHLLGIVHLVVWLPLGIYLWKSTLSAGARSTASGSRTLYSRAFLIWVALVFATIVISLVFDVRDIFLVLTGGK